MGFDALVTSTYLNRIHRKSNTCMHFLNVEQNSGSVSQSKFDPLFFSMGNTVLVLVALGCVCVSCSSQFLLEDKKETKFGGGQKLDRRKTWCIKYTPIRASARVTPSSIVYSWYRYRSTGTGVLTTKVLLFR